jgi:phosphotransacetylase
MKNKQTSHTGPVVMVSGMGADAVNALRAAIKTIMVSGGSDAVRLMALNVLESAVAGNPISFTDCVINANPAVESVRK